MQLICETLFPPRMSVTITFLTYGSYTSHSQSTAVVTTAPVYLFIARHVTHQNLIGYISNFEFLTSTLKIGEGAPPPSGERGWVPV